MTLFHAATKSVRNFGHDAQVITNSGRCPTLDQSGQSVAHPRMQLDVEPAGRRFGCRPPVRSACGVADGRRFGTLGCSAVIVPARFVSAGSVDRNVRPTIGGERFAPPVREPLDDLQSGNAGHQVHFVRGDEP